MLKLGLRYLSLVLGAAASVKLRRIALTGAVLAAVTSAIQVSSSAPASAVVPTFIWTGSDAATVSAGPDQQDPTNTLMDWSDPNNWAGGVAPAPSSVVNLVFPGVSGDNYAWNNIPGLTVNHLSLTNATGIPLYLEGPDSIILDGLSGGGGWLFLPTITLGQPQTWQIGAGGISISPFTTLNGNYPLNIVIGETTNSIIGGVQLDANIEVGPLKIVGPAGSILPSPTGGSPNLASVSFVQSSSVNGQDGSPVTIQNATVILSEYSPNTPSSLLGTTGPLTLINSDLNFFLGSLHQVEGNATLTDGSARWFFGATELKATGSISLANEDLNFFLSCSTPVGTTYTVFDAARGIRGSLSESGSAIHNGEVTQPNEDDACIPDSGPITEPSPLGVRVNYTSNTVTLTVVASQTYVALGDSFSSGEGNPPFLTGTSTGSDQCHRSIEAYPSLVASTLGSSLHFVACSGATTANIWPDGQPAESFAKDPEPLQESALSSSTQLVTITIGGDDIGFADVMTQCLLWRSCSVAAHFSSEVRNLSQHITQLQGTLTATYRRIKADAPNAAIYVIGYPYIVPQRPSVAENLGSSCLVTSGLVNGSLGWLAPKEIQLETVIANAAAAAGVHFVDPNAPGRSYSFLGHDICSRQSWVISITNRSPTTYSFHPNSTGQYELEQALLTNGI